MALLNPLVLGSRRPPRLGHLATLLCVSLALSACAQNEPSAGSAGLQNATAPGAAPKQELPAASLATTARKVLRSAELSLEVESPAAAQSDVTALVERLGGYVASSAREAEAPHGGYESTHVTLLLRVPSDKLGTALRQLKRLGTGAETERLGSEDVTDEHIDLEARIANQRRLEAQLAVLLEKASNVEGALSTHKELANVRTEIDRMEGRRRFLEKESELARLSLTLRPRRPLAGVSLAAIGGSIRSAAADALALAGAILTAGIRVAGVLLPLLVLFGLPGVLLWQLVRRRQRRLARPTPA